MLTLGRNGTAVKVYGADVRCPGFHSIIAIPSYDHRQIRVDHHCRGRSSHFGRYCFNLCVKVSTELQTERGGAFRRLRFGCCALQSQRRTDVLVSALRSSLAQLYKGLVDHPEAFYFFFGLVCGRPDCSRTDTLSRRQRRDTIFSIDSGPGFRLTGMPQTSASGQAGSGLRRLFCRQWLDEREHFGAFSITSDRCLVRPPPTPPTAKDTGKQQGHPLADSSLLSLYPVQKDVVP